MTNTTWNKSEGDPASSDVRGVASFAFLVLILLFSSRSQAADKPPAPNRFASLPARTTEDLQIATKIREALVKDAELRRLNLSVRVSGGMASLSGPIPSSALKQRAIRTAEKVEGVSAVHAGGLYVSPSSQRPKQTIVIEDDRPTQTRSASSGSTRPDSAPTLQPDPSPPSPPIYRAPCPDRQVTLLAPEAATSPVRVQEPARLTANPRPAAPVVSLAPAVEGLRRNSPRFQQIRILVREATVYIYPGGTSGDDVMTFAQSVRRLAGVQHVIIASGSH